MNDRESQITIEKRAFAIVVNLIRLLHMEELWSRGIPGLKRFVFILQKYMKYFLLFFALRDAQTLLSAAALLFRRDRI